MHYFPIFLSILIFKLRISDADEITVQNLFRRINSPPRKVFYPDEVEINGQSDYIPIRRPNYVRTIGEIAGRPIIPRRWTSGSHQYGNVVIDENGIAFPVRTKPNLWSILRPRGGIP